MPIGKITEKYDYARLKLVDGSYQVIKPEKIVGYCNYRLHRGYITANSVKSHDCIAKNCPYLQKFDGNSTYWSFVESEEKKKRDRKAKIKDIKAQKTSREVEMNSRFENIKQQAQGIADRLDMGIIITRVAYLNPEKNRYEYVINYVSDLYDNDWHQYIDIAYTLGHTQGGKYILRKLKLPNGKYATIDDWEHRTRK